MFRHLAERVVGHRGGRIHAAVRLPFRDAPPLDPEVPVDHGTPSIPSVSVRADARGRPAAPSPGEQHGESPIAAAVAHPRPAADRVPEATRTPGRQRSATMDEVAGKDARDIDGDSDSRATPRVPEPPVARSRQVSARSQTGTLPRRYRGQWVSRSRRPRHANRVACLSTARIRRPARRPKRSPPRRGMPNRARCCRR